MKQFILLMLAIAVVFGFGLGDASLWDIDEAIYADIARNMAETGDWVFPVFNSEPRFLTSRRCCFGSGPPRSTCSGPVNVGAASVHICSRSSRWRLSTRWSPLLLPPRPACSAPLS